MIPIDFKKLHPIEKGKIVKKLIDEQFNIRSFDKILSSLSRINCYRYGKIKKLTQEESLIYEFLNKNKLNSRPCYDWILLLQLPSELVSKYKNKELDIREVLKEFTEWRTEQHNLTFSSLINDVRNAVREL